MQFGNLFMTALTAMTEARERREAVRALRVQEQYGVPADDISPLRR